MSGTTTPTAIAFTNIPVASLLVPGVYSELDPQASASPTVERALLIGSMFTTGSATPGTPVQVPGAAAAQALFGAGSMLAVMASDYRLQDPFGEVWAAPQTIPTSGSAPTATMTFTGPATVAGNIFAYVGGQLVQSAVSAGDSTTTMAANWAAAASLSLLPNLPVTVSASAGVVTLTARDRTIAGSDVDLQINYLGSPLGQVIPAGVTVTFSTTNMSSGGVANPSIASSLALLGSQPFDFIVSGFADATNLGLIVSLLNDASGRWSWAEEIFGHALAVSTANQSAQTSLAASLNDQHISIAGAYGTPWPAYRVAADWGGAWAVSCRASPALPVQNIALNTPAPALAQQFDISERNTLLADGVATIKIASGATVLERMVTTYTTNAAGVPDTSYQNVEVLDTLTYVIRDLRTYLSTTYARKILVADGTPISGGSFMTTAQTIKADVISRYQTYCNDALCQNYATFAANALAQNQGNGVVALQLPIDVAGQLRVIAMSVALSQS